MRPSPAATDDDRDRPARPGRADDRAGEPGGAAGPLDSPAGLRGPSDDPAGPRDALGDPGDAGGPLSCSAGARAPGLTTPLRWTLPGTPWAVRSAGGPGTRPALELYEGDELLDVMVYTPVSPQVLRGGWRAGRRPGSARPPQAIAWGRLPVSGRGPAVSFVRGRLRRRAAPADLACLTSWCWVAVADGDFRQVEVSAPGERHRGPLRSGRTA